MDIAFEEGGKHKSNDNEFGVVGFTDSHSNTCPSASKARVVNSEVREGTIKRLFINSSSNIGFLEEENVALRFSHNPFTKAGFAFATLDGTRQMCSLQLGKMKDEES